MGQCVTPLPQTPPALGDDVGPYLMSLQVILVGIWQLFGGMYILIPVWLLSICPPRASMRKLTKNLQEHRVSYYS